MGLFTLLQPWRRPQVLSAPRRPGRVKALLELLEDRSLLSASIHLDFGPQASPVLSGYTGAWVSNFDPSQGYGWVFGLGLEAIDRGQLTGTTALTEDFVQGTAGTYQM